MAGACASAAWGLTPARVAGQPRSGPPPALLTSVATDDEGETDMTTTPVTTRAGTLLRDGERRPRRGFRLAGYLLILVATMAGLAALGRSGTGANVAAHAAVA